MDSPNKLALAVNRHGQVLIDTYIALDMNGQGSMDSDIHGHSTNHAWTWTDMNSAQSFSKSLSFGNFCVEFLKSLRMNTNYQRTYFIIELRCHVHIHGQRKCCVCKALM